MPGDVGPPGSVGLPDVPESSKFKAADVRDFDPRDAASSGGYYYAHKGRTTDYKVPTAPLSHEIQEDPRPNP